LDLAVELGHERVRRRPARERVPVRTVGRGHHVPLVERAADADRDRLLPDRDVQEARQLTGAEPLLDLLLEAADEEHLAEAVPQILLGAGRGGLGPSANLVGRLLARLDGERVDGRLELLGADELPEAAPIIRPSLAGAWETEVARLPPDWSDLYCEVRLTSTDYL